MIHSVYVYMMTVALRSSIYFTWLWFARFSAMCLHAELHPRIVPYDRTFTDRRSFLKIQILIRSQLMFWDSQSIRKHPPSFSPTDGRYRCRPAPRLLIRLHKTTSPLALAARWRGHRDRPASGEGRVHSGVHSPQPPRDTTPPHQRPCGSHTGDCM